MLSWLVVGVGDITRKRVLPAILAESRSRLAGIVTRDPAKAEPYGVKAWSDLASALAESDATAVYIATPVFMHAAQTIEALRAGRHVLCEKPMALNYAEALAMQRASEDTRRTLGIAYYRRMYPKVDRARELMEAGAIGRMTTLVQPLEVEDNATVTIEYEGGVRGVVDVRWHSRVVRDEFRVRGTDGEIDLSPLNGPELAHPGGVERLSAAENLNYPCVEDFVSAIVRGILPRSYGEGALAAEWVMEQVPPYPASVTPAIHNGR